MPEINSKPLSPTRDIHQPDSRARCPKCRKEVSVPFPMSILQGYPKCPCTNPGTRMLLSFVSPSARDFFKEKGVDFTKFLETPIPSKHQHGRNGPRRIR